MLNKLFVKEGTKMSLKYLSKGESSNVRKPKFYISYYEKDKTVIEKISEFLFRAYSCDICYCDYRDQLYVDDLKDMHFIFIPVFNDQKTLCNNSCLEDLSFAKNHNIPVVPVLMSSDEHQDFYKLYESAFGSLQLLMPYSNDSTKIDFEQQLKQLLETRLSNNDDSIKIYQAEGLFSREKKEKILKAFRSNIFISYRKKNRSLIRSFISEIHQNKNLEDVMLWYDEFLIPGENYTEYLKNYITNCDIFLLIITPDTLERNNYILTHEYPAALNDNKTIIAVELVPSDRILCNELFPKLDKFISNDELSSFHSIIDSFLFKSAISYSANEKNYWLGVAYIEGIYTEIDLSKGIKLLEVAANNQYELAVRKLINIYNPANVFAFNYPDRMLYWLDRLIDICQTEIDTEEESIYHRNVSKWLHLLHNSLIDAGDWNIKLFNFSNAMNYYQTSLAVSKEILKLMENSPLKNMGEVMTSISYCKLANVYYYTEQRNKARECLNCAAEIQKNYENSNISYGNEADVSETWAQLARLEATFGNIDEAIEWYLKLLNKNKKIHILVQVEYYYKCSALMELSYLYKLKKEYNTSSWYANQFTECAENYNEEIPSAESKLFLTKAYWAKADLFATVHNNTQALMFYKKAFELLKDIYEHEETDSGFRDLLTVSLQLSRILYNNEKYTDVVSYLSFTQDIFDNKQCKITKVIANDISEAFQLLGNSYYKLNKWNHARNAYKMLLTATKKVYDYYSDNPQTIMNLASAYYKLGSCNPMFKDVESMKKAAELFKKSYIITNNSKIYSLYQKACDDVENYYILNEKYYSRIKNILNDIRRRINTLDISGIHMFSNISNIERFDIDIIEFIIMIIGKENYSNINLVENIISQTGINSTTDEVLSYTNIFQIFDSNTTEKMWIHNLPDSIMMAVELDKKMNSAIRESFSSYLLLLYYIIGECIVFLTGDNTTVRKRLMDNIYEADMYLENSLI